MQNTKSPKKIPTLIEMDSELKAEVKIFCSLDGGRPLTSLVHDAIRHYLNTHTPKHMERKDVVNG